MNKKNFNIVLVSFNFLLTIWFTVIMNKIGVYIGFVNKTTNEYTVLGWLITIIVILIVVSLNIINVRKITEDKDKDIELDNLKESSRLYYYLIQRASNINDLKYMKLVNFIKRKRQYSYNTYALSTMNTDIINRILDDLKTAICQLFYDRSLAEKDIVVTLAYNINGKWRWCENTHTQGERDLVQLITNKNSCFYFLLHDKRTYVFYNEKKKANKKKHYLYDSRDADCKNRGSILCKKISCKIDDNMITGLLSISTYGNELHNTSSEYSEDLYNGRLKEILAVYENAIREELIKLYIVNNMQLQAS